MRSIAFCLAVSCAAVTGCGTSRQEQLEAVAKDWCLSIRASQVIPVYPLTEDLQPGDVFLVRTTVHKQQEDYRERGFLSLDQHFARLGGMDYPGFYADSYFKGDYAPVPHDRPVPVVTPEDEGGDAAERTSSSRFPDAKVPKAAFPSYAFEVRSGSGGGVAIPVQGVPLGLSLMSTDHASGSITIADAFTYGIDIEDLLARVNDWATGDVRDELGRMATISGSRLYLRIVNRIYLTGSVTVSLQNMAARSGGLDAGAPRDASILDLTASSSPDRIKQTSEAFREALSSISGALNEGAPGASIRIAAASKRSIAMREDFDRPLVIGYLGFDLPVYNDGTLGPPVATREVLEGIEAPTPPETPVGSRLRTISVIGSKRNYLLLKGLGTGRANGHVTALDGLVANLVPANYPVPIYAEKNATSLDHLHDKGDAVSAGVTDFRKVPIYLLKLNESIAILREFLAKAAADNPNREAYEKDLRETVGIHDSIYRSLHASNAFREAMTYAGKVK